MQVDARGVPLSLVVTGAHRHDVSQLPALLDARVLGPRPDEDGELPEENLCADAGYAGKPAEQVIRAYGYVPHVRSRTDEKAAKKKKVARKKGR